MELKNQITGLAGRYQSLKGSIQTEEATKNAFVMPMLQFLGYDVFNPLEVVPEFVADIGKKKGEKIDYAIIHEGKPVILIECKHHLENLDIHDTQLKRYFSTKPDIKFALLTNGVEYRFYTDLEATNVMDDRPFLVFRITDMKDIHFEELAKFHKSNFDVGLIQSTASDLKYTGLLKGLIREELRSPSSEFVKLLTKRVYEGIVTAKVQEQFDGLVKRSATQVISDLVNERLQNAINKEKEAEADERANAAEIAQNRDETEFTEDEHEGFLIIRAILQQYVDASRVAYRDAKSYCAVLLDDNNRKSICRLYFNGKQKYLGLFDADKKEERHPIEKLSDIYQFSSKIVETLQNYEI